MLKRSGNITVSERQVYTLLQFFGDVGGLAGIVVLLLNSFMSFFVPSALTRDVLNNNFRKDGGNYRKTSERSTFDPEVATA